MEAAREASALPGAGAERRAALTRAIKDRARMLGFDAVGVAAADVADPEGRLNAWLARGFGAGLDYMAATATERVDPRRILPGARSVIALSTSYWVPERRADPPGSGKVCRYARGEDYHKVIRRKVRKLRKLILELEPTARVAPSVDTSAILEREWARRAGIAWIGKSTMAISTELGTYTFLATLVTDVELDADVPHRDRCGSCTACLDACPTGAFAGPHQLDARRCITYWTVEHRGAIPPDAPPPHGWIAGCDVCQEVCPWNKFARPTRDAHFLPRPELLEPDVVRFAAEEERDFLTRVIAGTALQRTGTESMRRNALRVLAERERG